MTVLLMLSSLALSSADCPRRHTSDHRSSITYTYICLFFLSVRAITLEWVDVKDGVHVLDHIQDIFEYQGNWVRVKIMMS